MKHRLTLLAKYQTQTWLCLILLLGAALRFWFLVASGWMIEGDEAAVGLQALHILRGERPIFFPGQTYLGNFESYVVAGVFALFGASPYTLKLTALVFALIFIYLTFQIGFSVLGSARGGLYAALLAAMAPAYFILWSVKARGGFIEALVLSQLAILWGWRWMQGATRRAAFITGFVSGYAAWMNPISLYALIPLAMIIFFHWLVQWRSWRQLWSVWFSSLLGVLSGLMPLLLFHMAYGDTAFAHLTDTLPPRQSWPDLVQATWHYFGYDALPTLIGLRGPKDQAWRADWRIIAIPIYVLSFIWLSYHLWHIAKRKSFHLHASRITHHPSAFTSPLSASSTSLLSYVLLLAISLAAFPLFVVGSLTSGNFAVIIPDSGLLTRYLLPLYILFTLLLGVWLARLKRWQGGIALTLLCLVHLTSWLGANPVVWARNEFANQPLPPHYADLITFLEGNDLRAVYANHWIGYPLMFESRERLVTHDHTEESFNMDRFPAYGRLVKASPRPALVVFNPHFEPNPIDSRLRALNIAFRKHELPSFIIYYDFVPFLDPTKLNDVLVWPYW